MDRHLEAVRITRLRQQAARAGNVVLGDGNRRVVAAKPLGGELVGGDRHAVHHRAHHPGAINRHAQGLAHPQITQWIGYRLAILGRDMQRLFP